MTTEHVLSAGGVLPASTKPTGDTPVDAVHARAYAHPGLGNRRVVTLVAAPLSEAQDLEMQVVGFGASEDLGSVGQRRRRALGFPGWALLNDPDNAKYALSVVQELEKAARRAKSKPGHAKTAIDAIAKKLERSVPHFLPSFYEETGRRFIGVGSPTYAAQYFEKAREAERVHALDIDENERRGSFQEFALAGAVTIKTINGYAKELAKSRSPEEAYHHFRELCVRRTLGGMPPWGSMAKELRKLAKAAGLDPKAEDAKLLAEIVSARSLAKAPSDFWKTYRDEVIALAKDDPEVRGALLNLFPDPKPEKEGFDDAWLDLLEEAGALEALFGDAPAPAQPTKSRAAWISKQVTHQHRGWSGNYKPREKTFALLRKMAPTLKSDGEDVAFKRRWYGIDLDLTDLALELGLSVAPLGEDDSIDLSNWASDADEPERGRDPIHVAEHPQLGKALAAAVGSEAGESAFEKAARGKKGLEKARREWLHAMLARAGEGGLPDVEEQVEQITNKTSPKTFAEFPEAYEKLKQLRVLPALGRSLRGGLVDELGWPALEEAALEFAGDERPKVGSTWPYLIFTDGKKVIVVGPEGRALEHDLYLPKQAELRDLRFVGGQLFVVWRDGRAEKGYWSDAPKQLLDVDTKRYYGDLEVGGYAVALQGGVSEGGPLLKAGDTHLPDRQDIKSDGQTIWRGGWGPKGWHLKEYDPLKDKEGRKSLPAFFEDFAAEGKELDLQTSWLVPLPDGVTSPFGSKDGIGGWRVRAKKRGDHEWVEVDDTIEYESIDGRAFTGALQSGAQVSAILELPDGARRPVHADNSWDNSFELEIWDESGKQRLSAAKSKEPHYRGGSPWFPPAAYFHFLTPRDPAGSKALRGLGDDVVEKLLSAALEDVQAADESLSQTLAAVEKLVPGVTNDKLRIGVAYLLAHGATISDRLKMLVDTRDPEAAPAGPASGVDVSNEEISNVVGHQLGYEERSVAAELGALATLMAGKKAAVPQLGFGWWEIGGQTGSLAYQAAAFGTQDEKVRDVLLRYLEVWASTPFAAHPERTRHTTEAKVDKKKLPFKLGSNDDERFGAVLHEGSVYYLHCEWDDGDDSDYTFVEHTTDGTFRPLPGVTIGKDERGREAAWSDPDAMRAFVEAAREKGPLPWNPEDPPKLAEATGLSLPEATLLLAGLPNFDSWENNFLKKDLRTTLGLKAKEAQVARDSLKSVEWDKLRFVLDGAIPDDPARLWEPGVAAEQLATSWNRVLGKRAAVPQELLMALEKSVKSDVKAAMMLNAFADPGASDILSNDGVWVVTDDEDLEHKEGSERVFDEDVLTSVLQYIPWLFTELPVGDTFRSKIPDVLEAVRARLASDTLLLGGIGVYEGESEKQKDFEKRTKAFFDALGGEPYKRPGEKKEVARTKDTGEMVALQTEWHAINIFWRPGQIRDWDYLAKIGADSYWGVSHVIAARWLLSDGATEMAARVKDTPVPEGSYEANPKHSAPDVVLAVGGEHDVSEDAAVLYLQTLALAGPTSKRVQLWNDWKPARYKKAAKELTDKKLLLEAKRARAGRSHFLPGAWEALKSPHLPIETWKAPMYGLALDAPPSKRVPLGVIVPTRPLHALFAEAWERVKSGDVPRYEEVGDAKS